MRASTPIGLRSINLLSTSIMPLGILTVVVLGVILFGITTATESAGVGAAGAFLLALQAKTLDWKRTKEAVLPDRENNRDGVLVVRRLGALLRRFRHPRRSGAG